MEVSSRKPATRSPDGAQSVSRVATVLKLLAEHRDPGLRFVDVARLCGLEQPTAHRMLKALEREEMVARDPVTRRYRLGPLVFELGIAAAADFNLVEVCRPSLQRLAEATGDTAFLFIRRGHDAVCIDRIQGHYPIQTPVVTVGSRQPLGVNAGGLAILQALPDEEVAGVEDAVAARLGAYGEFDALDLRVAVAESRKRGYAAIGEKAVPGVTAIGLPVRNTNGVPAAALTIAATSNRMTVKRQQEILPALQQEVLTVQRLLYR
ncbi:IclR family transcriptional regulator [Bordetella sp. N]|uniref:IclR family transcriptional regulator n=1 Tax=Bordetella sp. N TaxID=1746199 RepID=UPI000710A863|nr:IclR family transcriptional regulator [Bordetella sp. N]ALM84201.1 IclR family transcriptional regulator [Bordetella sp. N]